MAIFKKIISLILTVMMLISIVTVGMVSASADEEVPTKTRYINVFVTFSTSEDAPEVIQSSTGTAIRLTHLLTKSNGVLFGGYVNCYADGTTDELHINGDDYYFTLASEYDYFSVYESKGDLKISIGHSYNKIYITMTDAASGLFNYYNYVKGMPDYGFYKIDYGEASQGEWLYAHLENIEPDGTAVYVLKWPLSFTTSNFKIEGCDYTFSVNSDPDYNYINIGLDSEGNPVSRIDYYEPPVREKRTVYFSIPSSRVGLFNNPLMLSDRSRSGRIPCTVVEETVDEILYSAEVETFSTGVSVALSIQGGPGVNLCFSPENNYAEISYEFDVTYRRTHVPNFKRYVYVFMTDAASSFFEDVPEIRQSSNNDSISLYELEKRTNGVLFGGYVPCYEDDTSVKLSVSDCYNGDYECNFTIAPEYDFITIDKSADGEMTVSYGEFSIPSERESRTVYFCVPASMKDDFSDSFELVEPGTNIKYKTTVVESTDYQTTYAAYVRCWSGGNVLLDLCNGGPEITFTFNSDCNCADIDAQDLIFYTHEAYSRPVYVFVSTEAQAGFSYPVTSITADGYDGTFDVTIVKETDDGTLYSVMLPTNEDGSTVKAHLSNDSTWDFIIPSNRNCARIEKIDGLTTYYDNYYEAIFSSATPELYDIIINETLAEKPFSTLIKENESFSFGIAPIDDYVIDKVEVNGKTIEEDPSYVGYSGTQQYYTIDNVKSNCNVLITIKRYTHNITFDNNAGVFSIIDKATEVEDGSDYTFSVAVDNENYCVESVTVNGNVIEANLGSTDSLMTYTIENVTSDLYIYISVKTLIYHNLTFTGNTDGYSVISGNYTKVKEGDYSFTLTTLNGYGIEYVTVNGNVIEANVGSTDSIKKYTVKNVTSDLTIHVEVKEVYYKVSFDSNNKLGFGIIDAALEVRKNSNYSFSLVLSSGYVIESVTLNGKVIEASANSTDSYKTYTVKNVTNNLDIDVVVNEKFEYCAISFQSNMDGFGIIGKADEVKKGSDYTFSLTPSYEYAIESVTVNGIIIEADNSGNPKQYTVKNVTSDLDIYVTVREVYYEVTFVGYNGADLGIQTVAYGEAAVAPAAPEIKGFKFTGWDKDFDVITGNITVKAIYVQTIGLLKIDVTGGSGFKIKVGDGAARPQGMTYYNSKIPTGTLITVTAVTTSDAEFIGWTNPANGQIVSTDLTYSFRASGNDYYQAIFVSEVEGVNMVMFYNDKAGQYWDMQYYAAGDEINYPDGLPHYGYEFIGWDHTDDEIQAKLTAGEDVTVTATWERVIVYIDVNAVGGTIVTQPEANGQYIAGRAVEVTANEAESGKKFAYWVDEKGVVRSFETTYKFYPTVNTTMTAVFVSEYETVDCKVLVSIDSLEPTEDGNGSFIFSWYVPEVQNNIKYQASGIVAVNKDNYDESTLVHGTSEPSIVFDRTITGKDAIPSNSASWIGPVKDGQTWVARAWVQYTDANGELHTVYSDLFEVTKD